MQKRSPLLRIAFAVIAIVVIAALVLHASVWRRTGEVNWPILANLVGLLLLMVVGAVEPASRKIRLVCSLVAALLVVPSAVLIWLQSGAQ
jgi:hypothetical protein